MTLPCAHAKSEVEFGDGIGDAETARMDVTWYVTGAYSFHYTDAAGVNWRFDRHPDTPDDDEKAAHASIEVALIRSCLVSLIVPASEGVEP